MTMEDGTGGGGYVTYSAIAEGSRQRAERENRLTWAHVFDAAASGLLAQKTTKGLIDHMLGVVDVIAAWSLEKGAALSLNTRKSKPLFQLQMEVAAWAKRNFGDPKWQHTLMGVAEELGELNHALLKQEQGIRGSWESHEAKAKDAVGDLLVYLLNLCTARGWDMDKILSETWEEVSKRDWKKNPQNGAG